MFKSFLPDQFVKNILLVTPEELKDKGIKAIITDLDNTLVAWDCPAATPEVSAWTKAMLDAGLRITVVSNNNEARVKAFCDPIALPFIFDAKKPLAASFNRAVKQMGVKKDETVVVGDQLMTDILGGNRAGIHTILVVPVANSDAFATKFNRMIERKIMARLQKQGLIKWEE